MVLFCAARLTSWLDRRNTVLDSPVVEGQDIIDAIIKEIQTLEITEW
jgi:hypothetical protein